MYYRAHKTATLTAIQHIATFTPESRICVIYLHWPLEYQYSILILLDVLDWNLYLKANETYGSNYSHKQMGFQPG